MGKLEIDNKKCTGCQSCVLACSFAHTDKFSMLSGIKIKKNKSEGENKIFVCRQCEEPDCVNACPVEALEKDPESGIINFYPDKCIGCKQCIAACPYNALTFVESEDIIRKCDLCGDNEPICEKVCTAGAITFTEHL